MTLGVAVAAISAVTAAKSLPFEDVKPGDWFEEYVRFVYERDLMKGLSAKAFGPMNSMTRGQIVTILARMSGDKIDGAKSSLNFTDVDPKQYYADPIGWAVKNGIAKGKGVGKFDPDAPVLRQEFAAFFVRYMKYKGIEIRGTKVTAFPDTDIPDWAKADVETLHSIGFVKGDAQGKYNPQKQMNRAEIATVTTRFVEAVEALPGDDTTETGEVPVDPPAFDLKKFVEDYLEENTCIVHNKLDFTFNYSSGLTQDSLLALLKKDMGLPDTVDVSFDHTDEFEENWEMEKKNYQDRGDAGCGSELAGDSFCWFVPFPVIFTDTATGQTYETDINFSIRKVLCSAALGYPNGVKS